MIGDSFHGEVPDAVIFGVEPGPDQSDSDDAATEGDDDDDDDVGDVRDNVASKYGGRNRSREQALALASRMRELKATARCKKIVTEQSCVLAQLVQACLSNGHYLWVFLVQV